MAGGGVHRKLTFNEVYYQCVHVRYDNNPGQDVEKRYFKEEEQWLCSKPASDLVFAVVCAMYSFHGPLSFEEECFMEHFKPLLRERNLLSLVQNLAHEIGFVETSINDFQFPTMTCPVSEIPLKLDAVSYDGSPIMNALYRVMMTEEEQLESRMNAWRQITNDYTQSAIEKYIRLYTTIPDQLQLLDRIEKSCSKRDFQKRAKMFNQFREAIENGKLLDDSLRDKSRPFTYDMFDDSDEPHIMLRDRHHTHVDIPSAGQVYINSQNVHNHTKDEEKEK